MVELKELLKNKELLDLPKQHQDNLLELLKRINLIREEYKRPFIVTSGYRSIDDHLRIYKEKADDEGKPFDPKKVPMGSQHLKGAAVDISDPKGELWRWCLANTKILEKAQLWVEDDPNVPRVHFQIFPYGSWKVGKSRFFKP